MKGKDRGACIDEAARPRPGGVRISIGGSSRALVLVHRLEQLTAKRKDLGAKGGCSDLLLPHTQLATALLEVPA